MKNFNDALKRLINERISNSEIKEIYAESLPEYQDPEFISCALPDIQITYKNGTKKIIKIYNRQMSRYDIQQHNLFKEAEKNNSTITSYEYYFIEDL